MYEVGSFTDSAARKLKNRIIENMWKGWIGIKRGWDNYYVSYSEEFDPLILPELRLKTKEKWIITSRFNKMKHVSKFQFHKFFFYILIQFLYN